METEKKTRMITIDFNKVGLIGVKVAELLSKRTKDPIEAYVILRWLCINFEATYGFQLDPQQEDELRKMAIIIYDAKSMGNG